MTDRTSTSPFDHEQQADVAAYWEVYSRIEDQVAEAAIEALRDDSALRDLVAAEGDVERRGATQELARRGVEEGDWGPYLERLTELGATYAERGVAFDDWFRIARVARPLVVPHVVDAHAGDPERLTSALKGMGAFFDLGLRMIGEAYLASRERRILRQGEAIAEISTPVLSIRPGLLLLPLVGVIDTQRSRQLTERLLRAIRADRGRVVVMDITGVVEVDTEVANRLIQAAEAARLMGATPIITGISPGVAQTLVALGIDLRGLTTVGDLQGGIERADAILAGAEDGVERSDA